MGKKISGRNDGAALKEGRAIQGRMIGMLRLLVKSAWMMSGVVVKCWIAAVGTPASSPAIRPTQRNRISMSYALVAGKG